jgi:predicted NAD/FAD-binding protein
MSTLLSRRDLLRTLAAGTLLALPPAAEGASRRSVGIVGAGAAGVTLAWLLDGLRDVVLFEASDVIGGNVREVELDLGGRPVVVDMGAQYFHPGPYPAYAALLRELGLDVPDANGINPVHGFAASFTLAATGEAAPRFVSPILWDRLWPVLAPWNFAGLQAFATAFVNAKIREQQDADWRLSLGEWLPMLGLGRDQWEGMILPWAASLNSGDVEQARDLSARAAMIFAAKALPDNPFEQLQYFVLRPGLRQTLERMLAQASTVTLRTGAAVQGVSREPNGRFKLRASGRTVVVDDLVLACSGPSAAMLLAGVSGTAALRAAVSAIPFYDARLALHTDPLYAPDPIARSFLNCQVSGGFCEASMWMAPVLPDAPPDAAAGLYKSWVTHRDQPPAATLYSTQFTHVLPSIAAIDAIAAVERAQGRDAVWLAGGYLAPYDSQETAVRSALQVAASMRVRSHRALTLEAAL